MATFINGQRHSRKLVYDGFIYRKGATNISTQGWRCEEERKSKCKGTASTPINGVDGCTVHTRQEHNHPPDPIHVELAVGVSKTMDEACNRPDPPRRIVSNFRLHLSEEAQVNAPKRKAMTQRIQRKRRKLDNLEAEPKGMGFKVPDKYRVAMHAGREVRFLLHNDGEHDEDHDGETSSDEDHEPSPKKIIVFASDFMLDVLSSSATWMLDGTFKVVPDMYFQLYTIHAVVAENEVFPVVYALLPNKKSSTYVRLFDILKRYKPGLRPETVICDFERASHTALKKSFGEVNLQGCFFHLKQAVWRKTQELGLRQDYLTNLEIHSIVKSLPSLAFLPPNHVARGFESIEERVDNLDEDIGERVRRLIFYFEDTYVGRVDRRGRRRAPPFPPAMWSVRTRTEEGVPRTQNKLEGWHRGIQTHFDGDHPSMWRFIAGLQREEGLAHSEVISMRSGVERQSRRTKYQLHNERLKRVVAEYNERDIGPFLVRVSHSVKMSV